MTYYKNFRSLICVRSKNLRKFAGVVTTLWTKSARVVLVPGGPLGVGIPRTSQQRDVWGRIRAVVGDAATALNPLTGGLLLRMCWFRSASEWLVSCISVKASINSPARSSEYLLDLSLSVKGLALLSNQSPSVSRLMCLPAPE